MTVRHIKKNISKKKKEVDRECVVLTILIIVCTAITAFFVWLFLFASLWDVLGFIEGVLKWL